MMYQRTPFFLLLLLLLSMPGGPSPAQENAEPSTKKPDEKEHKHEEGEEHDHDHDHGEKPDPARALNTVVLDEAGVANLGIETAEAGEGSFEETIFALGRIEVLPGQKAIVSSRIPGRAFSVLALPDQEVDEGEELMWVESRQPGDPPPTVMLAAPIAGTIAKVDIVVGKPIEPTDSLIEIININTVEAAAHVPEHLAGKLAKGQKARIKIAGYPDKVFEAPLAHIGAYADGDSGAIEAAFHVPNPEKLLRPGMRAEFAIVVSARENVMSIPREALQGDAASGRFVFIRDYELENAFVKTPVSVGALNDQSAEITSGLFAGDEVVTRGAYSLSYAGKGNVSLKEALDAAHGHPHNEDGTEMSKEQIEAAQKGAAQGGGNAGGNWSALTTFFAAATGLLLTLLVVSLFLKRPQASA